MPPKQRGVVVGGALGDEPGVKVNALCTGSGVTCSVVVNALCTGSGVTCSVVVMVTVDRDGGDMNE